MQDWNYLYASVQGKSHIEENIVCQDFCDVFSHDNYCICVVSDGAGSCINSHIGSRDTTKFAIAHFSKLIEEKKWNKGKSKITNDEWMLEARKTLKQVRDDLEKFSSTGLGFETLSCTLIVVIQLKNKLLLTHIGDGRAGYCTNQNEWFSMMTPYIGTYSNQTVFITSNIWEDETSLNKYIESNIIDTKNLKAFCLLTDGCENASFECYKFNEELQMPEDINKPYKDFFEANVNVNIPNLIKDGKEEQELNEIWASFLKEGNTALKNENDDKTMILAIKNIEKKSIN